jgi:hypothetical protein
MTTACRPTCSSARSRLSELGASSRKAVEVVKIRTREVPEKEDEEQY